MVFKYLGFSTSEPVNANVFVKSTFPVSNKRPIKSTSCAFTVQTISPLFSGAV